jgi:hypothetical protein
MSHGTHARHTKLAGGARDATERRFQERARFGGLFVNKHIDGQPHLARVLDLSAGGMMVRKVLEPAKTKSSFAVELGIPWTDERFWIWTRCVRDWGDLQALRFMGLREDERERLAAIVAEARLVA